MARFLIGAFLVAHGLVHIAVWATPASEKADKKPFIPYRSWLIGSTKSLAATVAIVVTVILVAGGVALFVPTGVWRPLTIVGLAGSLFLDVLYFNPWLIFITAVNGAFLAALVWAHWPSQKLVGA